MKLDIERFDIRYRMLQIMKYSISMAETLDIDALRYRRNIDIEPFYIDIDSSRYRINVDIEVHKFDIGIYR
jgi:hypothetical protein